MEVMEKKSKAIGIDLGTTYSCVAYFKKGEPRILKTTESEGATVAASCVGFDDKGAVNVGTAAKRSTQTTQNLVYDSKRMIGRKFADPVIQEGRNNWLFDVIDVNGCPNVKLYFRDYSARHSLTKDTYSPEEISAEILKHLKHTAEYRMGHEVVEAVVTVPAYFNTNQKKATMQAAEMAGLKVLRLLSEPVAAAIAYAHEVGFQAEETILVFDLGGGTLDVTILTVRENNFVVKAHAGNTKLGGQDFTNEVMKYAVEYYNDHYNDTEQITDPEKKRFLLEECEMAKRALSNSSCLQTLIRYYSSLHADLKRTDFELMNKSNFESALNCIEDALRYAKLGVHNIDRVILTGGSTRIPKIHEMVKKMFNGKALCTDIDPDEAVAKGAAIYAAVLTNDQSVQLRDFVLTDVTPLSLGVSTGSGDMTVVVTRNSQIPVRQSYNFMTRYDNQASCSFLIYAGERPLVKDNTYLGTIELSNITVAPRGVTKFDGSFELDNNGILTISATETGTTNTCSIQIKADTEINCIDIGSSLEAVAVNRSCDDAVRSRQNARRWFEEYVYEQKHSAKRDRQRSAVKKKAIMDKCAELIKWIEQTELAEIIIYDEKRTQLDYICRL